MAAHILVKITYKSLSHISFYHADGCAQVCQAHCNTAPCGYDGGACAREALMLWGEIRSLEMAGMRHNYIDHSYIGHNHRP